MTEFNVLPEFKSLESASGRTGKARGTAKGVLSAAAIALLLLFGNAASPASSSTEQETYLAYEIDFHFAQEKNLHHYTMLVGKLTDLVREQGRIFKSKHGATKNFVIDQAEEYLNDANGSASAHDYDGAYRFLQKAYGVLKASLQELGVKESNVVPSASEWKILR